MSLPLCFWQPPPVPFDLPESTVHLWFASLEQPEASVMQLAAYLSPDEQGRAARFRFERDRRSFTIARGVLRSLLGRYLNLLPEEVRLAYGAQGKPELDPHYHSVGLRFNLSHSGAVCLVAIAQNALVGVDVEAFNPRVHHTDLVNRFFSTAEQQDYHALPKEQQIAVSFALWTSKEAYLKAIGSGLSGFLEQVRVVVDPQALDPTVPEPALLNSNPLARLVELPSPAAPGQWSLRLMQPLPGYTAALAIAHPRPIFQDWHWPFA
jgi:4'-phosphopantetheinyl transferase